MFIASFYMDYNNVGITKKNSSEDNEEDKKEVTVWVATGRDQFAIIRRLINNNQSDTLDGVNVNLQLVAAGTLLPSVLAGTGRMFRSSRLIPIRLTTQYVMRLSILHSLIRMTRFQNGSIKKRLCRTPTRVRYMRCPRPLPLT